MISVIIVVNVSVVDVVVFDDAFIVYVIINSIVFF